MSFGQIMFYCITSAIIDRYIYPVYPLMLLCVVILFMDKSKKYCLKEPDKKWSEKINKYTDKNIRCRYK